MKMPTDVLLPCVVRPEPFDSYLDAKSARALALCRSICGTCPHKVPCLAEWGTLPGVIAGKTEFERKRQAAL